MGIDGIGKYPTVSLETTDEEGTKRATATIKNRVKLAEGDKVYLYLYAKRGSNTGSYALGFSADFGLSLKRTGKS